MIGLFAALVLAFLAALLLAGLVLFWFLRDRDQRP
jgi:hypothetical protein